MLKHLKYSGWFKESKTHLTSRTQMPIKYFQKSSLNSEITRLSLAEEKLLNCRYYHIFQGKVWIFTNP